VDGGETEHCDSRKKEDLVDAPCLPFVYNNEEIREEKQKFIPVITNRSSTLVIVNPDSKMCDFTVEECFQPNGGEVCLV